MKKLLISTIFLISWLFVSAVSAQNMTINSFDADILIQADSTVDVIEIIEVDFLTDRHGIFRNIPFRFKTNDGTRVTNIDNIFVTDLQGATVPFSASKQGGDLVLKIGDADKFIFGEQVYVIEYSVNNALNSFSDHDELFWNVTGDEWESPIVDATATVSWPDGINDNQVALLCFTGFTGSKAENCSRDIVNGRAEFNANDFLTIVVGLPKGFITFPSWFDKNFASMFSLLIPIIVFLLLFRLWQKYGKDPKGSKVVVVEYDPPYKLKPAEIGVLMSERFKHSYLSATLVSLAVRGFLHIKKYPKEGIFTKEDYELTRKEGKRRAVLDEYEKEMLNALFGKKKRIKISDLPTSAARKLNAVEKNVYDKLIEDKFFVRHPKRFKWIYYTFGVFSIILAVLMIIKIFTFFAFLITGILFIVFGKLAPQKTVKGAKALEQAKGFELYIETAEKYRVKWQEEKNMFEQFLPYAMVFGLADKWSKVFKDVVTESPDWYSDSSLTTFSAINFVSSLDSTMNTVTSAAYRTSSAASGSSGFGGGGFSGGGFGGGGGGSW